MRKSKQIEVTGFYMENRSGTHFKFYTVLIAEDGTVVTNWGRIGTSGQHKIDKLPTYAAGEDVGMRQVYSKKSRSYQAQAENVKIVVDEKTINDAHAGSPDGLIGLFNQARHDPSFGQEQTLVLRHYDDFANKAHALLNDSASLGLDEMTERYQGLKASWDALADKHAEVEAIFGLTGSAFANKIMGV